MAVGLNVQYRDVRYAVPFLIQLWLFAILVAYPAAIVPAQWQAIYRLNPMVGVIEGFRWALLGQGAPPPVEAIAVSVGGDAAYCSPASPTSADLSGPLRT